MCDKVGHENGCYAALEFGNKVIDLLFVFANFVVGILTGIG